MAGLVRIIAAGLLALGAALGGCQAENRMQATLDKPAMVTAGPATAALLGSADFGGARHVLITIAAFTPPPDKKPVEVVVSAARAGGGSREIGRFAITPYAPFVRGSGRQQNFALALPADLAGEKTLTLSVALVPVRGGGQGARLEVGSAALQ